MDTISIVVAICTYRRPLQLKFLLDSLLRDGELAPTAVVVVDNDVGASASEIVAGFPEVVYAVEPRRGIATARNLSVEIALSLDPWAIAFIDDDEIPEPGWLHALAATLRTESAEVATGPVIYDVSCLSQDEILSHQYLTTRVRGEGASVKYVATNNTLVLSSWLRPNRFDRSFDLTGGEDLELFLRLQGEGARCVWSSSARVRTSVPPERLSARWILRRELRNGQLMARLHMMFEGWNRASVLWEGFRRLVRGVRLVVVRFATNGEEDFRDRLWVADGAGWLRGAFGWYYKEYRVVSDPTPGATQLRKVGPNDD